jgi:DNA-binding MarR family transcriptional regulator
MFGHMDIADALSRCLVLNTVSAARTLLRRYDRTLKTYGVTVQQFALLAALRVNPTEPVAELARKVALDRTSLTRNLDLLEKRGLVRRADNKGNARLCTLSQEGDQLLDALLREWNVQQDILLSRVSEGDAATYLRVVEELARD